MVNHYSQLMRTRSFGAHTRKEQRMQLKILTACSLAASLALSGAAHAWSTDGHGHIRCRDGSSATVAQMADGYWTATSAGTNGRTGGRFAIEGQAALYACGE